MKLTKSEWGKNVFLSHYLTTIAREKGFKIDDIIVQPLVKFGIAGYNESPSKVFFEEENHIIYFGDVNLVYNGIFYFGVDEGRGEPKFMGTRYEGIFRSFRAYEKATYYAFNGYKITLPRVKEEYRH